MFLNDFYCVQIVSEPWFSLVINCVKLTFLCYLSEARRVMGESVATTVRQVKGVWKVDARASTRRKMARKLRESRTS